MTPREALIGQRGERPTSRDRVTVAFGPAFWRNLLFLAWAAVRSARLAHSGTTNNLRQADRERVDYVNHYDDGATRTTTDGYGKLALALGLSLGVMYLLTMAFVADRSHFYFNLSNFYMALTMVAPMGLIMLLVMRSMFPRKRFNVVLAFAFALLFFGVWRLGRAETFVGNEQFLRAMIPHHSRAILVCENADITDADIERLCDQIVTAQEEEIATMEAMLETR